MELIVSTRKKRVCSCLTFLPTIMLLLLIGCSNNSSSSSYLTSNYFPLDCGWETDKWTLFTDERKVEIDGISTTALVDTGTAEAYFWSNDKNGLRLHGVWTQEAKLAYYSEPIRIANMTCRVGDSIQTRFTLSSDTEETEYFFSSDLIGTEDVTTSAGVFYETLKFRIHAYPAEDSTVDHGYQTIWLAENVGIVQAQTDANSHFEMFAKKGETRQLISYFHTLSGLTADEEAVRAAYTQWIAYRNDQNLTGITDILHDSYFETCRDKAAALDYWDNLFNTTKGYKVFTTIEDVAIDDDEAYVLNEFLELYADANGDNPVRLWGRATVRLKKQNGDWKIYGNQFEIYPNLYSVYPRYTPPATKLATPVEITDCADNQWADSPDQIATLTITGPPGSGIVDFELIDTYYIGGWIGFWNQFELSPGMKNGFYTFDITDVAGNYIRLTDYLSTTDILDEPVTLSPVDGATDESNVLTFEWLPVSGANSYELEVYEVDDVTGDTTTAINEILEQTTYSAVLSTGTTYEWRVRGRYTDPNDADGQYDSESRCDFRTFSTSE